LFKNEKKHDSWIVFQQAKDKSKLELNSTLGLPALTCVPGVHV